MLRKIYTKNHVKIWFNQSPDEWIPVLNEKRLILHRLRHPDHTIYLIGKNSLISENEKKKRDDFCKLYNIIFVDIDELQEIAKSKNDLESETDVKLFGLVEDQLTDFFNKNELPGSLAAASDVARFIACIQELGIYSDLDIVLDWRNIPEFIEVKDFLFFRDPSRIVNNNLLILEKDHPFSRFIRKCLIENSQSRISICKNVPLVKWVLYLYGPYFLNEKIREYFNSKITPEHIQITSYHLDLKTDLSEDGDLSWLTFEGKLEIEKIKHKNLRKISYLNKEIKINKLLNEYGMNFESNSINEEINSLNKELEAIKTFLNTKINHLDQIDDLSNLIKNFKNYQKLVLEFLVEKKLINEMIHNSYTVQLLIQKFQGDIRLDVINHILESDSLLKKILFNASAVEFLINNIFPEEENKKFIKNKLIVKILNDEDLLKKVTMNFNDYNISLICNHFPEHSKQINDLCKEHKNIFFNTNDDFSFYKSQEQYSNKHDFYLNKSLTKDINFFSKNNKSEKGVKRKIYEIEDEKNKKNKKNKKRRIDE